MDPKSYFTIINTPLQKIEDDLLLSKSINLYLKREDLILSEISGNKWYKLKYNLIEAENNGIKQILTFGGAYSNHIFSTAAACNLFGFESIGIIRGEEHLPLNPTLSFAVENGMKLFYLDRSVYRDKYNEILLIKLKNKFGNFYLVPEGGSNSFAVKGCSEIIKSIAIPFDYICTPCGTGGTLAGIVVGLNNESSALGFSVLKGSSFLNAEVERLILNHNGKRYNNWSINFDYHFGGYAKYNLELINFINTFYENHKIKLEPIYTGKMLYGIYDLIKNDFFKKGQTIIAIHTGGLQGLKGINTVGKNGIKINFD